MKYFEFEQKLQLVWKLLVRALYHSFYGLYWGIFPSTACNLNDVLPNNQDIWGINAIITATSEFRCLSMSCFSDTIFTDFGMMLLSSFPADELIASKETKVTKDIKYRIFLFLFFSFCVYCACKVYSGRPTCVDWFICPHSCLLVKFDMEVLSLIWGIISCNKILHCCLFNLIL